MKIAILTCLLFVQFLTSAAFAQDKPNIVYILVDNWGWGDISVQRSTVSTPRIDAFAAEGLRLTNFNVQNQCTPTRSALHTGRLPITVSLPVTDLTASKTYYTALGFVNNPQFTDDAAAFMVWSESDQCNAFDPREVAHFYHPPNPADHIERSRAHCLVRFTRRRRCNEHIGHRTRWNRRHTSRSKPSVHVWSQLRCDTLGGHVWGAMWMDMSAMPSSWWLPYRTGGQQFIQTDAASRRGLIQALI